MGLTRTVLNWGSGNGCLGSDLFVVSACGGATAVSPGFSLDADAGSIARASCLTFAGQWSCDLDGMGPVF